MLTPRQTLRRLFSRIAHPWAFFGGLAVQAADITFGIIVSLPGDSGQYLVRSDHYLNGWATLLFWFIVILDLLLTINGLVTMARLKRRGWFIGLLLGSISGAAILLLPGLALMVFGFSRLAPLRLRRWPTAVIRKIEPMS